MSKAMKSSVFTDPACYPAISLHQPYAGAVRLSGLGWPAKRIETRKTRIHYRGPLVICATAKSPEGWQETATTLLGIVGESMAEREQMDREFLHTASAVVIANVVGCRPLAFDDRRAALFYAPRRWAWILEDITPLRPFAVRGIPGYFKVPRVETDLAARLALGDMFEAGGAPRVEAGLLGSFAWPLLGWREGGGA